MGKKSILWSIIASIIGLLLAVLFVPNVWIDGDYMHNGKTILFAGIVLGILNCFAKPILNLITLPLRILSLGLISIVINILIIWAIDILFPSFHIKGFLALVLTSIVVFIANVVLYMVFYSLRYNRQFLQALWRKSPPNWLRHFSAH